MNVILISGYIGVGKTTFANYLKEYLTKRGCYVVKMSFADKVKEIARKDFFWDGEKDAKGRRLLQVIGTEAGRKYDPDIWVKHIVDRIDKSNVDIVIVDDWRFPNEYEILSSRYNVITVRITGVKNNSNHISEKALDKFYNYDVVFENKFISVEEDFNLPAQVLSSILCPNP